MSELEYLKKKEEVKRVREQGNIDMKMGGGVIVLGIVLFGICFIIGLFIPYEASQMANILYIAGSMGLIVFLIIGIYSTSKGKKLVDKARDMETELDVYEKQRG